MRRAPCTATICGRGGEAGTRLLTGASTESASPAFFEEPKAVTSVVATTMHAITTRPANRRALGALLRVRRARRAASICSEAREAIGRTLTDDSGPRNS